MGPHSSISINSAYIGLSELMKKSLYLYFCIVVAIFLFQTEQIYGYDRKHQVASVKVLHEETERIANKSFEIVGLGDSLTEGVGDPYGEGYIGIVKDQLETHYPLTIKLSNEAEKGLRSEQLLKQLNKKNTRDSVANADLIFLSVGANDMLKVFRDYFLELHLHPFEKQSRVFANNLEEIIKTIRKENKDAPILMLGFFNPYHTYFSDIDEINQIIQMWNEQSGEMLHQFTNTYFVEIASIFESDSEKLLHDDHFHPNRKGYEKMAYLIMDILNKQVIIP